MPGARWWLRRCEGARLSDRRLLEGRGENFIFDKPAAVSFPGKILRFFGQKSGVGLTTHASFWKKWTKLLMQWGRVGENEYEYNE